MLILLGSGLVARAILLYGMRERAGWRWNLQRWSVALPEGEDEENGKDERTVDGRYDPESTDPSEARRVYR